MPENNRREIIECILGLADDIYRSVEPGLPPGWLTSDVTVAQLRILILLHTAGPLSMGSIASRLGVAVSTASGIVENLALKRLIVRQSFEPDRRRVIIDLSPGGWRLSNGLWQLGRNQLAKMLQSLTTAQLNQAAALAESLLNNVAARDSPRLETR